MLFKLRSGIPSLAENTTLSPLMRREATDRWATAVVKESYQGSSSSACSTDSAFRARTPSHQQVSSDNADVFPSAPAAQRLDYFRLSTPSFSRKCSSHTESDTNPWTANQKLCDGMSNGLPETGAADLAPQEFQWDTEVREDPAIRTRTERSPQDFAQVYISSPSIKPSRFRINWARRPKSSPGSVKIRTSCCF